MSTSPPAKENIELQKEEVITKITKWLKEEGHSIETGFNPKAYYFGIIKLYDKALETAEELEQSKFDAIHISIPNDFDDRVLIENVCGFSNIDKKAFEKLPQRTQHQFIFELKQALYQLNIIFEFWEMTKVRLSKIIFFDGLSKHVLFDTITAILAANRTAEMKYGQLSDLLISQGKDKSGEYINKGAMKKGYGSLDYLSTCQTNTLLT